MKKNIFIMMLVISIFATSCASTDKVAESDDSQESIVADTTSDTKEVAKPESTTAQNSTVNMNFKKFDIKDVDAVTKHDVNAPSWYNNPGEFYEEYGMDIIIGTGQATGRSASLTDKAAFAAAQANAAQQIITIINGLGTDETTSITSVRLSGAKLLRKAVDGDTYYVAVMVNKDKALETLKKTLASATKDNEAYTNKELDITMTEVQKRVDTVQTTRLDQAKN